LYVIVVTDNVVIQRSCVIVN